MELGGRSPSDLAYLLTQTRNFNIETRLRCACFVFRFLRSPTESWQHIALEVHYILEAPWLLQTLQDLNLVYSGVKLEIAHGHLNDFLYSTGWWSEVVEWHSSQAYGLPATSLGQPFSAVTGAGERMIATHVHKHIQVTGHTIRIVLRKGL